MSSLQKSHYGFTSRCLHVRGSLVGTTSLHRRQIKSLTTLGMLHLQMLVKNLLLIVTHINVAYNLFRKKPISAFDNEHPFPTRSPNNFICHWGLT